MASKHYVQFLKTQALRVNAFSIIPNRSIQTVGIIVLFLLCRGAYCHLKDIYSLKAFLIQETLSIVLRAFVTYPIDYCNNLLCGIFDNNINNL